MCDVCACALLPVFRAEEDMFGPSPLPATCASLSAGALRKGKAALAKLGEKKNNNQNQRLFSSMQALPVAIYTLLRGYLCPLPTAGWGIFLDLVFLVGYSPAVQGRVRLMPGLWSLRCLALMVV